MTSSNLASSISRNGNFQMENSFKAMSPAILHTSIYVCAPCVCEDTLTSIIAICSDRNFTSVPQISKAVNISILLVDSNQILKLKRGCFSRYTNLYELNLASNKLTTIDDGAFQTLHKLQVLNLENNNLKYVESVFRIDIFRPLRNVKVLLLNNNNRPNHSDEMKARYPDKALSVLESLEELYLDGMTNQSFGEGFSNLTNLTHLSLAGYRHLIGLFNTTFTHVRHVKLLNLSACDIRYIEPGTFVPLRSSLEVLDISHNTQLKMNNLFNGSFGWQHSNLRVLNFSYIVERYEQCVVLTKSNLKYMRNTKIEEIYADNIRIQLFEPGALQLLPLTLRKVTMKNSWFSPGIYMYDIVSLQHLVELDLSGLAGSRNLPLSSFDSLSKCHKDNCFEVEDVDTSCSVPATTDSEESVLNIGNDDTENATLLYVPIPPNLQILKNTFQQLTFRISAVKINNNSLKSINASFNVLSIWIGPVLGLNKLTHLDLSNNVALHVSPKFFDNFESLIMLNISNNLLRYPISQDINGDLFKNLKSVQILDLSTNNLNTIPEHLFKGLTSLQILKLSDNNIVYVPIVVKHMSNLQKIDFAGNKIEWLPKRLMSELDSLVERYNHSVTIDLSDNPISCECPNLAFLKWMRHTKVKQADMTKYFCLDYDGHSVNLTHFSAVIDSLIASCTNHKNVALASLLIIILYFLIFFACLMYKYRWKLRYWYYGIAYRFIYSQPSSDKKYLYDAFISYADDDQSCIDHIVETVEKLQKKLIYHKRDFLPGKPISINIFTAIKHSRKTVLLLSQNFFKSNWCKFEMNMAFQEAASTGRDVLLLLVLEDIDFMELPRKIFQLLQSDRFFLEYKDGEDNEIFFRRFVEMIEKS